jgi:hypothetical protein
MTMMVTCDVAGNTNMWCHNCAKWCQSLIQKMLSWLPLFQFQLQQWLMTRK